VDHIEADTVAADHIGVVDHIGADTVAADHIVVVGHTAADHTAADHTEVEIHTGAAEHHKVVAVAEHFEFGLSQTVVAVDSLLAAEQ